METPGSPGNRLPERRAWEDILFLVLGVGLALAVRFVLFPFESLDYHNFLAPWYDHLLRNGPLAGLKDLPTNYTPPYLYLLGAATELPFQSLFSIKAVTLPFDFAAAGFILLLVRLNDRRRSVWLAAFVLSLFAPTLVLNGAFWGQCDAVYTAFLLGALYCFCRERTAVAVLLFSVAFAFKLQAVFLFPVLVVLWFKRQFPFKYFLIIPAVYLVFCLPAFFAGRPLYDLLMVYGQQANYYPRLTSSAPNLYQWLPDNPGLFGRAGLVYASALVLLLCYVCLKSRVLWTGELTIRLALCSLLLVPFSLPYMHERYFFPADCVAIVYAFYFPRRFYVPLLVGGVSLFSYFPFLFDNLNIIPLPYLAMVMAVVIVIVLADLIRALQRDDKDPERDSSLACC